MRFMGPFARLTTMGLGRRENVISCPFSENQIVVKWNSRFRHLCVDKIGLSRARRLRPATTRRKAMSSVWLCSGNKHLNWVAILFKFIHFRFGKNPRGYKNLLGKILSVSSTRTHKSLGIRRTRPRDASAHENARTAFWLKFFLSKSTKNFPD